MLKKRSLRANKSLRIFLQLFELRNPLLNVVKHVQLSIVVVRSFAIRFDIVEFVLGLDPVRVVSSRAVVSLCLHWLQLRTPFEVALKTFESASMFCPNDFHLTRRND